MAATFKKNKERLHALFEKHLPEIVPKLFSLELISSEARDVALNPATASSRRAALLFEALEGAIVTYQDLLLFAHVLLSSRIDAADRTFVENLPRTPESDRSSRTTLRRSLSFCDTSTCKPPLPTHRRHASDPMQMTSKTPLFESISVPPPSDMTTDHAGPDGADAIPVTSGETTASPTTAQAITDISESETVISQESIVDVESVERSSVDPFVMHSSVWYRHSQLFPGIKFSNYYTKETLTYRGGVVKGEGIEFQIPGYAVEKEDSIEFTVQGCIDGPFELPDDISFASPVFVVTPHYEFQREITIGMNVFVDLQSYQDWKEMVFLTCPAKPKVDGESGPYWEFKVNDAKPQCARKSRFVKVQVQHLCLLCFGIRRRVPQYLYAACLYSPCYSIIGYWCHAVFSVSISHKVYMQNLKVYLDSFRQKFQETIHETPCLTQDNIQLILPQDVKSLGYSIVADKSPCEIMKSVVELPCHSRRHRRRSKRNVSVYPPRITLTATYIRSLVSPSTCELGISGVDGLTSFNMSIPPGYFRDESAAKLIQESRLQGPSFALSMSRLLNLPLKFSSTVNIPQQIGVQWYELCTNLLKREVAATIHRKSVDINECILQEWLDGKSKNAVSWEVLADAIKPLYTDSQLVSSMKSCDSPLTMNTLKDFPIETEKKSIPLLLKGCHLSLGRELLDDKNGTYIHELAQINCEELNKEILQKWLDGEGNILSLEPTSWSELRVSLLFIPLFNPNILEDMRIYSGPLTMNTLLNFPMRERINVPREVGGKYFDFGVHLLQDGTGAHIHALERELRGNAEDINKRILQEWLSGEGRPVTWATLVEVLNIIGKGELAKDIKAQYITSAQS